MLLKSSKVVSKVMLETGFSPRAASTASAVARIVPPTQKPSALIFALPLITWTRPIALIAASSMYWSQLSFATASSALRQLSTKTR